MPVFHKPGSCCRALFDQPANVEGLPGMGFIVQARASFANGRRKCSRESTQGCWTDERTSLPYLRRILVFAAFIGGVGSHQTSQPSSQRELDDARLRTAPIDTELFGVAV